MADGGTNAMARNEAFAGHVTLTRRAESMTADVLYSAATSRIFGKGARLGVYVRPAEPGGPAAAVDAMVYLDTPPAARPNMRVYRLDLDPEQPKGESTYRYLDRSGCIGVVQVPLGLFPDRRPERCWLEMPAAAAKVAA